MAETMDVFNLEIKDIFANFKKSIQSGKKLEESSGDAASLNEQAVDPLEMHFTQLFAKIDEQLLKLPKDNAEYIRLLAMKSSLFYEKAKQNLTMNRIESSESLLETTLKLIEDYVKHPQITFLYLRIINHLSYIYSRTGNLEKAKDLLENVVYYEPDAATLVYCTEDLFNSHKIDSTESSVKLHKLVINNMQMLGWIYGKMNMFDEHAKIQHLSLQKQIDYGDTDPILWATRCSRLACLLLTQNQWVPARYHLTASEIILARLEFQLAANPELNKAQAELARTWVHYGLHLFSISKKLVLEHIYVNDGVSSLNLAEVPEDRLPENYEFTGIAVNVLSVSAAPVTNHNQARNLFIHTHKWLKRSRLYYTLRDHPLQYVNSVLDLSELYRFLAYYEPDLDSQYNVQKKRYDSLEALCTILKEVRPSCYFAVSVELLKELADVQIELMSLNLKRLHAVEAQDMTDVSLNQRINAMSGIHTKLDSLDESLVGAQTNETPQCSTDFLQDSVNSHTEISNTIIINIDKQSDITQNTECSSLRNDESQ